MDPFTLATGIAGILSLTLEVTKIVADYTKSVKAAADESHALAVELSGLTSVLESLKKFLASDGARFDFQNTSVLYSTTSTCHGKLISIRSTLKKFMERSEGMMWYRRIAWPIKRDEHKETVATLHQCMGIFQFSLSVDGW